MTAPAISKRKASFATRKWKPHYEPIVLMSCNGNYSQEQIGAAFNLDRRTINLVLQMPQAAIIRRRVLDTLHERIAATTIPERLERLALKAVENIEHVITDPDIRAKRPIDVYDRSKALLESQGHIKTPASGEINGKTVNIFSDKAAALMAEGMMLSDQGRMIHRALVNGTTPNTDRPRLAANPQP